MAETDEDVRLPWYSFGRCNDCHLSAAHCDCPERSCYCGKLYRPQRGESACHRIVPIEGDGA